MARKQFSLDEGVFDGFVEFAKQAASDIAGDIVAGVVGAIGGVEEQERQLWKEAIAWLEGSGAGGASGPGCTCFGATGDGAKVVEIAMQQKGTPYHWGGNGPNGCKGPASRGPSGKTPVGGWKHGKCFDCSGLVRYCYAQLGYDIGNGARTARAMAAASDGIEVLGKDPSAEDLKTKLAPGDVVYFYNEGKGVTHVAIALGDGKAGIIHAPGTGDVVKEGKATYRKVAKVKRYFTASGAADGRQACSCSQDASGTATMAGSAVRTAKMVYTTYCPGYGSKSMQGDSTTACGAKLTIDESAPLGYRIDYRGKTYYYACAVKFQKAAGEQPLVPDVRFQTDDLSVRKAGNKEPKWGIRFKGSDPGIIFLPLDVFAPSYRGKSVAPDAMDILCAKTEKARAELARIVKPALTGVKRTNNYSRSATEVEVEIVRIDGAGRSARQPGGASASTNVLR